MGDGSCAYRILVWKPEGKRPLGRLRHRWEDNIKMEPKEIRYVGMDLIHECLGSLVDFCELGNEYLG
jgi:hypothetical protein